MKIALRYYTRTGNTEKLVQAMTRVLGIEALNLSHPLEEEIDFLFLGNSYYVFNVDPEVVKSIASLDEDKVGKIVNSGPAAMLNSTWKEVKKEADKLGIPLDSEEFHCKGESKGIHKGRSNEKDIRAVEEFAKTFLQ